MIGATLAEVEAYHIAVTFGFCEGSVRETASMLRINERTLRRKLKTYAIEFPKLGQPSRVTGQKRRARRRAVLSKRAEHGSPLYTQKGYVTSQRAAQKLITHVSTDKVGRATGFRVG